MLGEKKNITIDEDSKIIKENSLYNSDDRDLVPEIRLVVKTQNANKVPPIPSFIQHSSR